MKKHWKKLGIIFLMGSMVIGLKGMSVTSQAKELSRPVEQMSSEKQQSEKAEKKTKLNSEVTIDDGDVATIEVRKITDKQNTFNEEVDVSSTEQETVQQEVMNNPSTDELAVEEVPAADLGNEEIPQPMTQEVNQGICGGIYHNNGICDGSCVNTSVGICGGIYHNNGICDGSCANSGSGNGICNGSGHHNGICDGSCVAGQGTNQPNYENGSGQNTDTSSTTGTGQGYGHRGNHGSGHGGRHRQ